EQLMSQKDLLEVQKQRLSDMLSRVEEEVNTNGWVYSNKLKLIMTSLVQMTTFEANSEVNLLKNRLVNLEAQRDNQLKILTEVHQSVKDINEQIIAVYLQIYEAAKSHRNAVSLQINQKSRKIASIGRQLNTLPQERQRQNTLLREVENNQKVYDDLKTQVMAAQMNQSVDTENIQVLEAAMVPEFPVNGNKKQRAMVGVLVGFLLGVVIALLLEFLDKSIKSPDEVKKHLKLNILGTIPEIEFQGTDEFKDEEKIKQIDNQLVTHDYSPTPIGEAYRSLRTNLLFSKRNGQIRKLVITSTAPGDGKSFTSSNVAISMAQQRTNTLLVDADLRRGVLHNTFGISKEPGFTNFLTNSHTFNQVVRETHIPNLSVVSCGSLLPNPSELLGSLQMKNFIEQAERRFDIIIFDSPPLNAATDAVVIGTQVDGVVLVVRFGVTNRDLAKAKMEMFKNVPAKILGCVLNGGDANLAHEAYSYYHY
ncbi:polysaccharide biosynthesis tyrosine autokinase, partial [candidate division KSB1 bacterium]|nr:polysaccharide biosynthesis tyrosine autokinase [candidate division KSB1 bacterium]